MRIRVYLVLSSFLLCTTVFAQRNLKLGPNRSLSLYGAVGYPYQSAGITLPLGSSGWNLQGHFNTDLGGIATQLSFPDNQFIGATRKIKMNPSMDIILGAGTNPQLHTGKLNFGLSTLTGVQYHILPWFSIGATYTQPFTKESAWESYAPVVQAAGYIDLHWRRKHNGIFTTKKVKSFDLWMQASSGPHYNNLSLEISTPYSNNFALRTQMFTSMGTVFAEKSSLPNIKLAGATYSYYLNEVILKAGAGLGFDLNNSQQLASPYFMMSGQQYLLANSYLLLEIWQPMSHEFSGRRAPIVQVGLALKLI